MSPQAPNAPHRSDRRYHGLDYLRGLMIIVVVITHVAMQYQTMPAAERLISEAESGAIPHGEGDVLNLVIQELDYFWRRLTRPITANGAS